MKQFRHEPGIRYIILFMLLYLLDIFTQMMKDLPKKIYVLFIGQIPDEMSMIPRDLISVAFSRNYTPNKDLEQKLGRNLHILRLSKV